MTADEYGFRPMPPDGMPTSRKLLIGGAVFAVVIFATTLALMLQYSSEGDRKSKVLTQPYETPASYHYIATDEKGNVYEVWFQAPDQWRVVTPDGYHVSDGQRVISYETATNLYTESSAAPPENYIGLPVGPTTPEAVRERIARLESGNTAWDMDGENFLGRRVEVLRYGRHFGPGGYVHATRIDPEFMFILSSSDTSTSGVSYFTTINSIEYNTTIAPETFVATPPPGACPKTNPAGC